MAAATRLLRIVLGGGQGTHMRRGNLGRWYSTLLVIITRGRMELEITGKSKQSSRTQRRKKPRIKPMKGQLSLFGYFNYSTKSDNVVGRVRWFSIFSQIFMLLNPFLV